MSSKRVRLISLTGIILIALIIGISVFINVLMKETDEIPLPESSVSNSAAGGTEVPANNGLTHVSVTKENVPAVISTMSRPTFYTRTIQIRKYYEDRYSDCEIRAAVDGKATALKINSAGVMENIIITEDKLYIWYAGDKKPYEKSIDSINDEKNTSDEYQMMMSYEDVLRFDKSSITAADYMKYNGEDCIYVEYVSGLPGYTIKCFVSVDTGLLSGYEQYDGNKLIISMSSFDFNPVQPEMSTFNLPNGKNPVSGL